MVPKAITFTLVNFAKENLQRELLENLYKPDVLDELLKESPDVVARWVSIFAKLMTDDENVSRWSARSTLPRRLWLLCSRFVECHDGINRFMIARYVGLREEYAR